MWRIAVILVWLAAVAHADGMPYGDGPCEDIAACQKACRKNAEACIWAGHLIRRGGGDDTKKTAAPWYEKGCAKGDGEACWYAAMLIDPGGGATPDAARRKARTLYDKACTKKIVRGCVSLSKLDGAPDDAKAKRAAAAAMLRAVAIVKARCAKQDEAACSQLASLQPEDTECVAATAADEIEASNEKHYTEALQKMALQPVMLKQHLWRDDPYASMHKVKWQLDAMSDLDVAGGGTVRVVAGYDVSTCGSPPAEYVLRNKQVWRVVRLLHQTSTKAFKLCGCPAYKCGGAAPQRSHAGYELPADTTYGGTVSVPYDVTFVNRSYTKQCAPPP